MRSLYVFYYPTHLPATIASNDFNNNHVLTFTRREVCGLVLFLFVFFDFIHEIRIIVLLEKSVTYCAASS